MVSKAFKNEANEQAIEDNHLIIGRFPDYNNSTNKCLNDR
jgi:hypothetical protein